MYFFFFILTLAMNIVVGYTYQQVLNVAIIVVLWVFDITIFFTIYCSKSSFIERDREVSFISLMETFDAESLCPFCRLIRLP